MRARNTTEPVGGERAAGARRLRDRNVQSGGERRPRRRFGERLRKRLAIGLALTAFAAVVGLFSAGARAHLTGVFLYFIKDFDEPTYSSRLLLQQIDDIDARIEELKPQVDAAREEYEAAAAPVADRLVFYDAYAASALGGLWSGSEDIVDLLAYSRMMERVLSDDLRSIEDVSDRYGRLAVRQRSLTEYRRLLDAIESAVAARERVFDDMPEGVNEEYGRQYVLYQLSEDWEGMRVGSFIDYFDWVNDHLERMTDFLEPTPNGWSLSGERLNARVGGSNGPAEDARFFLRADHVYFFGVLAAESRPHQVLTVGQMERVGPTSIQYRIEGIYLDGFPVDPGDPDVEEDIYENSLMHIDLGPLVPEGSRLFFRQENGSIEFELR